jgi:DNA-binding PadR family transcriptional regulator
VTPSRELLTGWLLALLEDGPSYGYELRRELRARGLEVDPSVLYRTLRQLDHDALLKSRWGDWSNGPRRRLYERTAKGREELEALTRTLAVARDCHEAFLQTRAA